MDNEILLSICIPTYNRADYLEKSIASIVEQTIFKSTSKIEIIISDNCSIDNTKEIVQNYIDKYGAKIKYFKNEKNIGFSNLKKVLSYGNGKLLKLHNDTLNMNKNSLKIMIELIENNLVTKPVLFFAEGNTKNKNLEIHCNNLDDFIENVSYLNTWIGAFSIWREQYYDLLNDFEEQDYTIIPQTYVLCDLISKGSSVLIYTNKIFESMPVNNKGGYNIAKIFGQNYLTILKEFVKNKNISPKVYQKEKKRILKKHINYFYFDIYNEYAFQNTGYFKYLLKDYWYNFYFYKYYVIMQLKVLSVIISKIKLKES